MRVWVQLSIGAVFAAILGLSLVLLPQQRIFSIIILILAFVFGFVQFKAGNVHMFNRSHMVELLQESSEQFNDLKKGFWIDHVIGTYKGKKFSFLSYAIPPERRIALYGKPPASFDKSSIKIDDREYRVYTMFNRYVVAKTLSFAPIDDVAVVLDELTRRLML